MIRNTYLNGLAQKKGYNLSESKSYYNNNINNKAIQWMDNNKKDPLSSININKELLLLKDIKPVTNHKKLKPTKSCLKNSTKPISNTSTTKLPETINSISKE